MPVQVSQNNSFPPKIASNLWFSDNMEGGAGGGGEGKTATNRCTRNQSTSQEKFRDFSVLLGEHSPSL